MFPDQKVESPGTHEGWEVAYAGVTEGPHDEKLEAGIGGYHDDNFDLLAGSIEAGLFSSSDEVGAGTQAGIRGGFTTVGMHGTLGDAFGSKAPQPAGTDPDATPQGGWQNFVSMDVHGPKASGEASIGTSGANLNLGAELVGISATVGGAEYDGWSLGGSELTVGAGVGEGAGVGLSWTDDDKDGYRELGASFGIEESIGGSLAIKSEIPAYIGGAIKNSAPVQYVGDKNMEGGDALMQGIHDLTASPGLEPTAPSTDQPLGMTR